MRVDVTSETSTIIVGGDRGCAGDSGPAVEAELKNRFLCRIVISIFAMSPQEAARLEALRPAPLSEFYLRFLAVFVRLFDAKFLLHIRWAAQQIETST